MIIDLSTPRLAIKDKIDSVMFEAKMRGYKITKHHAAVALAVALTFSSNQALAFQNGMKVDEGINQNLNAFIFSALEVIKQFGVKDLSNMRVCFNSAFVKGMFK